MVTSRRKVSGYKDDRKFEKYWSDLKVLKMRIASIARLSHMAGFLKSGHK